MLKRTRGADVRSNLFRQSAVDHRFETETRGEVLQISNSKPEFVLLLTGLLVVFIGFLLILSAQVTDNQVQGTLYKNSRYTTTSPAKGTLSKVYVTLHQRISPGEPLMEVSEGTSMVLVCAEMAGEVQNILSHRGDLVSEGQRLIDLDANTHVVAYLTEQQRNLITDKQSNFLIYMSLKSVDRIPLHLQSLESNPVERAGTALYPAQFEVDDRYRSVVSIDNTAVTLSAQIEFEQIGRHSLNRLLHFYRTGSKE